LPGLGTRLPIDLTTFVGRERELAATGDLLQGARLVTLTGVGGTGKTRLAIELAARLEGTFRDGARFVGLAPISDQSLIAPAIAQTVGLIESGHRSAEEAVSEFLRDAEMLLLLDNCEHLVDACATLVERVLKSVPDIKVLATSREPLEVPGEVAVPVPPLSLPPLPPAVPWRAMTDSEAIRLFADRAAAARPGFAVEGSNAEAVARICHHLDGLPLAIELAAARSRRMSPDEILERLGDRFSLLGRGPRTAEPRHQTLRATIDWSHDLLTPPERILFRRLSVFAGGWTLEDAERVCSDGSLPDDRILQVHARLADKCLVVSEPGAAGPTRHRFLETIREYAAERLADAGETEGLRVRHFALFLVLAEAYQEARATGGSDATLPELAEHRDNFRAALVWSERADPEGALRLTAALDDVWRMIGAAEGWGWLQRTLPGAKEDSPYRIRALLTAGMLSAYVPAYAEGAGLLAQAAALARRAGDRAGEAWADLWLGRLAFFGGDVARAQDHLERALAAHRSLGIRQGEIRSLALLGLLQGLVLDQREAGERNLEEALAMARETGDSWGEGYAHLMLGLTAADAEDLGRAGDHSRAALAVPSLGPILGVPLQGMARVAVDADPGRAMRLLGAAARHFEGTGTTEPAFVRRRAEITRARATAVLGEQAAARAFEEGRRLTLDDAIAYALSGERPPRPPGGLTRREAQVAALVARGMTNREIAGALFVSVRTAESHVDHILAKLALANRTQLAAWVAENEPPPEYP
jgi:predicted ATPase/DNA-binding CsgD family transcriptional regulator